MQGDRRLQIIYHGDPHSGDRVDGTRAGCLNPLQGSSLAGETKGAGIELMPAATAATLDDKSVLGASLPKTSVVGSAMP